MIFIQRAQPDAAKRSHTLPLPVSQSLSFEDGLVSGRDI